MGTKWVVRNYGTSIKADRFINKIPAQDRAIELQCIGFHAEELKNKDFIEQFPISSDLEEIEEESEKILAIGIALNQYSENGNPIIYTEDQSFTAQDEDGESLTVTYDPLLIENQNNLSKLT